MNDYSLDWPLYSEDGLLPDGEPQLRPRLAAEIRAWATECNDLSLPGRGFPDEQTGRRHWEEGRRLAVEIRRELGRDDTLELIGDSDDRRERGRHRNKRRR